MPPTAAAAAATAAARVPGEKESGLPCMFAGVDGTRPAALTIEDRGDCGGGTRLIVGMLAASLPIAFVGVVGDRGGGGCGGGDEFDAFGYSPGGGGDMARLSRLRSTPRRAPRPPIILSSLLLLPPLRSPSLTRSTRAMLPPPPNELSLIDRVRLLERDLCGR